MAISYVGRIGSQVLASGGTAPSITVGAGGVASGSSIILVFHISGVTTTPTSVTDTKGNTYVNRFPSGILDGGGDSVWVFDCLNVGTALVSGNTIHATLPANSEAFFIAENFSGLAGTTDGSNSGGGSFGSTSANSGNITTTNANDLLFGTIGWESSSNPATLTGATWTANTPINSGTDGLDTYYDIVSATSTYHLQAVVTSSYMAGIVAYKAASGGGGDITPADSVTRTERALRYVIPSLGKRRMYTTSWVPAAIPGPDLRIQYHRQKLRPYAWRRGRIMSPPVPPAPVYPFVPPQYLRPKIRPYVRRKATYVYPPIVDLHFQLPVYHRIHIRPYVRKQTRIFAPPVPPVFSVAPPTYIVRARIRPYVRRRGRFIEPYWPQVAGPVILKQRTVVGEGL